MSNSESVLHEQELDRLVDGELSEPDRRALIRRITDADDGWRRCALAFLEAQEWKRALAPLAQRDLAMGATGLDHVPARPREHRGRRVVLPMAIAGLILLAFVGGWAGGRNSVPALVQADKVGVQAYRDTPLEAPPPDANLPHQNVPQTDTAALQKEDESVDAAGTDSTSAIQVVGLMRIAGDVRAQQNYAVPVFAVTGADAQWQERLPSPYSDADLRRLRRDGYRVNRPLMRVDLADGRCLAIPLGTVQLQYVGAEVH